MKGHGEGAIWFDPGDKLMIVDRHNRSIDVKLNELGQFVVEYFDGDPVRIVSGSIYIGQGLDG